MKNDGYLRSKVIDAFDITSLEFLSDVKESYNVYIESI
jgi:hypothetical protein